MERDFNINDYVVSKYDPEGMRGFIVNIKQEQDSPPIILVAWSNGIIESCGVKEIILI